MPEAYLVAAVPLKKIILAGGKTVIICLPPGFLVIMFIMIVYLVFMMRLPKEQPKQFDMELYGHNYSNEYLDVNQKGPYNRENIGRSDQGGNNTREHHTNVTPDHHPDFNQRQSKAVNQKTPYSRENIGRSDHRSNTTRQHLNFNQKSREWENCSTSSEESHSSVSTATTAYTLRTDSTSASSRRARGEINERANRHIKQTHVQWAREELMYSTSPFPSPFSSPDPPFFKFPDIDTERWTLGDDDALLVHIAYYRTLKAKKSRNTFSFDDWWEEITRAFSLATGVTYVKEQTERRLGILHMIWWAWYKVLNSSGFGWDPVNKAIRGDDQSWIAYLQNNPEADEIRRCTFPLYEELTVIFTYLGYDKLQSLRTVFDGITPLFDDVPQ